MKSFQKLPPQFQCAEVKEYYDILCKKQGSFVLKRILDIFASVILLVFLIIPIAIIAILVKTDSKGPVFYRQERVTTYGKKFRILKFRTMVTGADRLGTLVTTDSDSRVTKTGRILRKYRLDELPQIFNVLKGEMSLVGPRPIIQEELERYGEYMGDYLMVKPGITGMWQVSGRSDIEYRERVLLDSWYVRNWSVWIDIVMLFKTFAVVAMRKGAY